MRVKYSRVSKQWWDLKRAFTANLKPAARCVSKQWWDLKRLIVSYIRIRIIGVSKQWWDLKERLAVIDVTLVAVLVNNDGI